MARKWHLLSAGSGDTRRTVAVCEGREAVARNQESGEKLTVGALVAL
jgi:hypothetical protein